MKVILRSTDLSLIQSAQIALEAQDIPTILIGDNATALPSSPITLAVEDQDFSRAIEIIRGLAQTRSQPWWEASWAPRALLLIVIVLVLILCGTLIL